MKSKPSVVYWNNIPTPYMVDRFNALADRGALDFEAWFNDRITPDRSWDVNERSWRFRYRYMPTTRVVGPRLRWLLPLFLRRPDVMISLYAEPIFLAGWVVAKLRHVKTGFWVEATRDQWMWIRRRFWKEIIKKLVFPRVDAIVTVGEDGKRFAMRYGASLDRIMYAPHVIDVRFFSRGSEVAKSFRGVLRERYQLKGITFIYVGRFLKLKGLVNLLSAFKLVQQSSSKETSLLLVGGGPEESVLRNYISVNSIENVVFTGFKNKRELPSYYAIADVFVFPTLGDTYGLVVDEAMACSLPVIASNAAGEIHGRIDDGVNGFIFSPDNRKALVESMLFFLKNPERCCQMGKLSYEKVKDRTPERWAEDFEKIVYYLIEQKR